MLEATLNPKPSLALPTATSSLLLVALFATTAGAQDLIKRGSGFPVNNATTHASHGDVTIGPNGATAVVFQGNLNDTWISPIAETNGAVNVAPNQLVASGNFTEPRVFPVPACSSCNPGAAYGVVRTEDLNIELQFPDDPGAPLHPIGLTEFNSSAVSFAYLTGSFPTGFGVTSRFQDQIRYSYFRLAEDTREPLATTFSTVYASQSFNETAIATLLKAINPPPSSGANARGVGHAPRTAATGPSLLMAELAHDAISGSYILGRFFDDAANPSGTEFLINPPSFAGDKVSLDLAASPSGIALVVWTELTFGRQPVMVLVGPQGPIAGTALFVSTTVSVQQSSPQVAAVGERFVVAWRRHGVNGGPDTIHARLIDASNPSAPVFGPEVEVSGPAASGGRLEPAIAADDQGRVMVVWTDRSPDLAFSDVLGQRLLLELPIFSDGFESGDTSVWSARHP